MKLAGKTPLLISKFYQIRHDSLRFAPSNRGKPTASPASLRALHMCWLIKFPLVLHELNTASQVDAREFREIPSPLYLFIIG